jgi:hypothetical protein
MAEYKLDKNDLEKLWVKNVQKESIDLSSLTLFLNEFITTQQNEFNSKMQFVLKSEWEDIYCYIFFENKISCTYGLVLNGVQFKDLNLAILRPPDFKPELSKLELLKLDDLEEEGDSSDSFYQCEGIEKTPNVNTRISRTVYFDWMPLFLEVSFNLYFMKELHKIMSEMNMGLHSFNPILFAVFNYGYPYVEMISEHAAVNMLNLNNFPFLDRTVVIKVPNHLTKFKFFTYNELGDLKLQGNESFALLDVGRKSTVSAVTFQNNCFENIKGSVERFENIFLKWGPTAHLLSSISATEIINKNTGKPFEDIDYLDDTAGAFTLFVETRKVSDSVRFVLYFKSVMWDYPIRFYDEREFYKDNRQVPRQYHLVLVKSSKCADRNHVLTLTLDDLHSQI